MARTVLPIVGAVVGFYFGGPTGAQIGFALGGAIGGAVDPVINRGPKIGEVGAQTSAEGAPRAIVYGVASVTGNVIATGPMIETTNTETQAKGGPVNETAVAYRNYAVRICEGPIAGVLRVWQDEKLVYDVRAGSLLMAISAQWLANKIFYLGTETQIPDIFLALNVSGPGETPAYRGSAYMVAGLEDLTDRRGSIPQYRFEVAKEASESVIALPLVVPRIVVAVDAGGEFHDYFLADTAMIPPGSCWLAYWYFAPTDFDTTVELRLVLGETAVLWSLNVSLTIGIPAVYKVQFNRPPDGELITAGFMGDFYGSLTMGVSGLTEDYHAYVGTGGAEAELYESTNGDFGVLVDGDGNLAYAGPEGESPQIFWGPPSIDLGLQGEGAILGDIVADIHDRCGIPATKFNRTELTDIVDGLVLAGDYTGGDAINTLRGPYFFDKTEYDRKLWYPKRGKAVVLVLDIDDLVEEPDTSRREQAVEFPKKLHLFYQHAASGYAAVKATSSRSSPDARVVGELSVQVPVVLDENEAAQIAHKLHKAAWAEAEGEVILSVPESFIRLVPSDNIGLSLRGQVKRLRIEKMEHAAGVIVLTMRHDRQSAYTSNVTGVPIPLPTPPPSTLVGNTTLAVMDIGARQDSEDDLHILVAGTGTASGWYGWTLQRSLDGGANWNTVQSFGTAAVMGELLTAVPAASEHVTDTTNTVRVQLYRDTQSLEDLTEAQFLSEGGAFALAKADGTWEVMQYRDASEDSAGAFTLSMLHRGRLNSGGSAHVAGAKFVMLSGASHVVMQSAQIGQSVRWRGVSLSQSPELATVQTATYVGRSQLEWPVASLTLSRASNIVTASWAPRHRFGTEDAPVASVNFTGYRVTIVGTSTVTFDQAASSFSYDVSAIGGGVTVSVQALNRITGPGPAQSGPI